MEWLIGIGMSIYIVALIVGLATGGFPVRVRDERARPKPVPAVLLAVLGVVLIGAVLSVLFE